MSVILGLTIYATGFATCGICKDPMLRLASGAGALIGSLQVKLAALRGKS